MFNYFLRPSPSPYFAILTDRYPLPTYKKNIQNRKIDSN